MNVNGLRRYFLLTVLLSLFVCLISFGQTVPLGIFYQAVARDNFGKELASKNIDVRFSIISENPLGTVVYQELHSDVITSKYGVFSLIIGHGTPTGGIYGELSQVNWSQAFHYLKIEVKFENDFIDMGTMQFLAVPYALYAQKSLEPGPVGPKGETGPQGVPGQKGDQGDPATDDQTLSFNGNNLSISGGNTVNLSSLNIPHQLSILGDTLSIMGGNKVSLTNQIQDLQLDVNNKLKINKNPLATEIDMTRFLDDKQQLSFNNTDNTLSITNGTTAVDLSKFNQSLSFNQTDNKLTISGISIPVDLTPLMNDADADPANEIQDLQITGNKLTITKKVTPTEINLAPYLDNTDNQTLAYNPSTYSLSISGATPVSIGTLIAFRAKKTIATSAPMPLSNVDFIPDELEYNDGGGIILGTGEFTAQYTGVYTFDIKYIAPNSGDGRMIMIYKNGNLYENLGSGISNSTTLFRTITIKLVAADKIKFVIHTGTGTDIGTGVFSGYRIY